MVASGFLPIAIHKNKLYFLFGKEAYNDSCLGFSDFAGKIEKNENNIYQAGLREMAEETTGFFGDTKDIDILVKKNGGFFPVVHNDYHIHIFRMDYDENLIDYYNKSHQFIYKHINHNVLKKSCIFEKIEISWMTIADMKKRRNEFREFYREIMDKLIYNYPKIRNFILKTKKHNKTRRINDTKYLNL
jgi:hypothetical protein